MLQLKELVNFENDYETHLQVVHNVIKNFSFYMSKALEQKKFATVRKDQDRSDILNQVEQIAAKEEEIQDLNPKRRGPPFFIFQLLLLLQTTQWS